MVEIIQASNPRRGRSPVRRVRVVDVAQLTPGLTRITFAGPELADFTMPRPAAHIKLHMQPEGVPWNPLDETAPRPPRRTYTPRSFDAERQTLVVDFVLHGHGLASDWAAQAKPGQTMFLSGPGGGYDVAPDARTLVIVADDTALPAVGMILEAMPPDCTPLVIAEVARAADEYALCNTVRIEPEWLHRDTTKSAPSALLEEAVRRTDPTDGPVYWWVACEAMAMRRIKQFLLKDRAVAPERLHVRGYWKVGQSEYPDHDYGKD